MPTEISLRPRQARVKRAGATDMGRAPRQLAQQLCVGGGLGTNARSKDGRVAGQPEMPPLLRRHLARLDRLGDGVVDALAPDEARLAPGLFGDVVEVALVARRQQ